MPGKIKILYIDTPLDPPGGGQISLLLLLKNLDRTKFEPVVFIPQNCDFAGMLEEKGIQYKLVSLMCLFLEIGKMSPGLIHCNSPTTKYTFVSALAAKTTRIPFIWHNRVVDTAGWRDRIICHLSDRVIVTSDAVKKRYEKLNIGDKIVKIHNGVDLAQYNAVSDTKRLKKEFNVSSEKIVGSIGRLDKWKCLENFIDMAKLVIEKIPDCKFFIVGDGDERTSLELRVANTLGSELKNKIIFTGYRKDIPDLISLFDVLVQPSRNEPFGRVVIEAMASGKPVVASAACGHLEIIENKKDGVLVNSVPTDLARAVIELLSDKNYYNMISSNAIKKAQEHFDAKILTKRIEDLYLEITM